MRTTPSAAAVLAALISLAAVPPARAEPPAPVRAAPATRPTSAPTTRPRRLPPVPTDRPSVKLNGKGQPDAGFLKQHDSFLARGKAGPVGVLMLGDSITRGWDKAPDVYKAHYDAMQPANFGIGGDRTEHVLWRIDHGELDDVHPKVVVLMIGTNNSGDTAAHVTAGTRKVVDQIHAKLPDAKLLLLAIFPRGDDPAKPDVARLRAKLKAVNAELAKLDDGSRTRYLDIGDKFLDPDGKIAVDVMKDGLHPTPKGYVIWADAMQPLLDEMMKGK